MIVDLPLRRPRRRAVALLPLAALLAACAIPPSGNPPGPFVIELTSADPLVLTALPNSYVGTIRATVTGDPLNGASDVDVDDLPAGWSVIGRSTSCQSVPSGDSCNIVATVSGPDDDPSGTEYDVTLTVRADGVPLEVDTTLVVP